jgi:hypothetical protein
MTARARPTDAAVMHPPTPRSRIRAAAVPTGSMRPINILLGLSAALVLLAAALGSLVH